MKSMKTNRQILFYGDSNTYGYDPADPYENRYPEEECWINILCEKLYGERPPLVRKFYSFQEWHDLRVMPFPVPSVHSAG